MRFQDLKDFYRQNSSGVHMLVFVIVAVQVSASLVNFIDVSSDSMYAAAVAADLPANVPAVSVLEMNAQLRTAIKQYAGASAQERATISQTLIQILAARREALRSLMGNDPQAVLGARLPAEIEKQLPPEAQALLETPVDTDGTVTVLHSDNFDSQVELPLQYYVESRAEGKRYQIHFAGPHADVLTGAKVHVRGSAIGEDLAVAGNSGGNFTVTTAASTLGSGTQNTIVILVSFANKAQTYTAAQIASTTFQASNSSAAFYAQNSNNAVNLVGDVVGPYTISYTMPASMTNAECQSQMYNWASAADKAASSGGANLSGYVHKIYMLPSGSCPGYGGQGTIGGNPSQTWIYGYNSPSTFSHELGHNLGVHHANSLDCGTVQIGTYSSCTNAEYGDASDVMGSGYDEFNGPHMVAMGWATGADVQTVTTSGTYTISPLETPGAVRVLKIAKPNTSEAYYISYRQPIGFFDNVASIVNYYAKGASVHVWNGAASVQPRMIDLTPGDSSRSNDTLLDGTAFGDPANGIKITQVSHSTAGVVVNVQIGSYTDTIAPSVTISNLSGAYAAGTATITTKAGDDVGVTKVELYKDGALFATSATAPFSFTWNTTLETGTSSTHSLYAKAYDAAGNVGTSPAVSVTVDNVPPTISISAPLQGATLTGSVSVKAPAADNVRLNLLRIYVDGLSVYSIGLGSVSYTGSYTWNTTTTSDGPHTIQATVSDAAGTVTASPIITVTTANGVADTIPPSASIVSPASGGTVSGTVVLSGSASDNLALTKTEWLVDNAVYCTNPLSNVTTATVSCSWVSGGFMNGSHVLTIKAYDSSGNSALSAPITLNVTGGLTDTQAPSAPQNVAATPVSDTRIDLSWSASSDNIGVSGYYVYRDGVKVGTVTGTGFSDTALKPSTSYSYVIGAFDAAGNVGKSAAVSATTQQGTPDTTPPTVTINAPADGAKLKGNSAVNISVSASDDKAVASIVISGDGAILTTCANATSCSYSWSGKQVASGNHTIAAKATDTSGNIQTASIAVTK